MSSAQLCNNARGSLWEIPLCTTVETREEIWMTYSTLWLHRRSFALFVVEIREKLAGANLQHYKFSLHLSFYSHVYFGITLVLCPFIGRWMSWVDFRGYHSRDRMLPLTVCWTVYCDQPEHCILSVDFVLNPALLPLFCVFGLKKEISDKFALP